MIAADGSHATGLAGRGLWQPRRRACQPGQARCAQQGQGGLAELHVPPGVQRMDLGGCQQDQRRCGQPGQRDQPGSEARGAAGDQTGQRAGQGEQRHRHKSRPRPGEPGRQDMDRTPAWPGQPPDLCALAVAHRQQRHERRRDCGDRYSPSHELSARWPAWRPGRQGEQRQPMGNDEQQREQVEQPSGSQCRPIAGPPPPPAVCQRADQQIGGHSGQHGHDRVRPGVLRVCGGLRRGHQQQPSEQTRKHRGRQVGRRGQPPAQRRREPRGDGHRQHRGSPDHGR